MIVPCSVCGGEHDSNVAWLESTCHPGSPMEVAKITTDHGVYIVITCHECNKPFTHFELPAGQVCVHH